MKLYISSLLLASLSKAAELTQTGLILPHYGANLLNSVMSSVGYNATDSDAVTNHGCWCGKLDLSKHPYPEFLGGSQPVDELDEICRDWFMCRHCNDKLAGGSCNDGGDLFTSRQYLLSGQYTMSIDESSLGSSTCVAASGSCGSDTCVVDLYYVNKIVEYYDNNEAYFNTNLVVSPGTCSSAQYNHENKICQGTAPYLSIVRSEYAVGYQAGSYTSADLTTATIPMTTTTIKPQVAVTSRSYLVEIAQQSPTDSDYKTLDGFTGQGTLNFTLEFQIKAISCAYTAFCEDDTMDKCIELFIGGWLTSGTLKSEFRSKSNEFGGNNVWDNLLHPRIDTPDILNPDEYKAFKITFTPDGTIRVFKTSDTVTAEINSLPRDNDGILVDNSYVISYETTPLMEIFDFQSNPDVQIVNGINQIEFGLGWAESHDLTTGQWIWSYPTAEQL